MSLVAPTLVGNFTWQAVSGNAPDGGVGNNHLYELYQAPLGGLSQVQAIKFAGSITRQCGRLEAASLVKGHLATLPRVLELEAISRRFGSDLSGTGSACAAWLGGKRLAMQTDFAWVTSEPWEDDVWAPGYPTVVSTEDVGLCLTSGGQFVDMPVGYGDVSRFLVEFDCYHTIIYPGECSATCSTDDDCDGGLDPCDTCECIPIEESLELKLDGDGGGRALRGGSTHTDSDENEQTLLFDENEDSLFDRALKGAGDDAVACEKGEFAVCTEGCFPKDAVVQVEGKGPTSMEDLKLSDKVLTGSNGQFSPIYAFAQRDWGPMVNYLKFNTDSSHSLVMSYNHQALVGPDQTPKLGKDLQVGDALAVIDGDKSTFANIVSITKIKTEGWYVPLTTTGTIVVDGVLASAYSLDGFAPIIKLSKDRYLLDQHQFQHMWYAPLRLLCMMSTEHFCSNKNHHVDGDGSHHMVDLLDAMQFLLMPEELPRGEVYNNATDAVPGASYEAEFLSLTPFLPLKLVVLGFFLMMYAVELIVLNIQAVIIAIMVVTVGRTMANKIKVRLYNKM